MVWVPLEFLPSYCCQIWILSLLFVSPKEIFSGLYLLRIWTPWICELVLSISWQVLQFSVSWEHNPDHSCTQVSSPLRSPISLISFPVMKRICWNGRPKSPPIKLSHGSRSSFIVLTNMCHLLICQMISIFFCSVFFPFAQYLAPSNFPTCWWLLGLYSH